MCRSLVGLVMLCLVVSPVNGQERTVGARTAALTAPLGDANALVVVRVDLARLDLQAMVDWTARVMKATPEERAQLQRIIQEPQEKLESLREAGGKEIVGIIFPATAETGREPIELAFVATAAPGKAKQAAEVFRKILPEVHFEISVQGDNVVMAAPYRIQQLDAAAKPSTQIAKAIDAAGEGTAQAAVLLPDDLRRVVREALPPLPEQLGEVSGKELAEWFAWGAVAVDLPPEPKVRLQIQATSEEGAKALQQFIASAYKMAGPPPKTRAMIPNFEKVVELLTPKASGERVELSLGKKEDLDTILPAVVAALQATRGAATRMQHMNNMKQFGLALHGYHDLHRGFPAQASYSKEGRKLLSWRVHVLPFVDAGDLYKQFHLDEPWDSEHNKKLIEKMPEIYKDPRVPVKEAGRTTFVAPIGEMTIFGGKEGMKMNKIVDGLSNTILLVESDAANAVIWTKPDDLAIDPAAPTKGLFVDERGTTTVLFADGSVRALAIPKEAGKLPAMFTASGGEVIPQ